MNRNKLKTYAPQARRDFIKAVTDRAAFYGLTEKNIEPVTEQGDVAIIAGKPFPRAVAAKRNKLEQRIKRDGFNQVIEAMAYTWFNRFVAIRYMELHEYLGHGYRVLSNPDGSATPEIVEHAEHVDLAGLDRDKVIELKLEGTRESDLYRMLLIAQCNALHRAMPFLFEAIDDDTELLVPENLLHSDSLIRRLVNEITEEDWQEVEIIGWLYQFYISEKKDEVIGKVVKSEDIPAATQLFTPNWIVKYMVQNTLGRQWMATCPNSPLKDRMEFYIEPAEQTPEVQAKLAEITLDSQNPEELTLLDPACGSGHILVEAYDLLKTIYQERGYRARDIPKLILTKNLFGLEIDERASQLAGFSLVMKARHDDRRFFEAGVQPHVLSFISTDDIEAADIVAALNISSGKELPPVSLSDVEALRHPFVSASTFGSLIQIPDSLARCLPKLEARAKVIAAGSNDLFAPLAERVLPVIEQAALLHRSYSFVIANPPYMGSRYCSPELKAFAKDNYPESSSDLFAMFIERSRTLTDSKGMIGLVTPFVWLFISTYASVRNRLLSSSTITSLVQLEYNAFEPACVPVCTLCLLNNPIPDYQATFIKLSEFKGHEAQAPRALQAIGDSTCEWRFTASTSRFRVIPSSPIIYWLSKEFISSFERGRPFLNVGHPKVGMQTSNNDKYLRLWWEVPFPEMTDKAKHGNKWVKYLKGGGFRRWAGNLEHILHFNNDPKYILQQPNAQVMPLDTLTHPKGTWGSVTSSRFSCRCAPKDTFHDIGGHCFYPEANEMWPLLGLLNSVVFDRIIGALNPTLNFQVGDVGKMPVLPLPATVMPVVKRLVELSELDWNTFERSWDFQKHPFLSEREGLIEDCLRRWLEHCSSTVAEMKELEERNNRLVVDAYGVGDQLATDVCLEQVSLSVNPAYRYSGTNDSKNMAKRFGEDTVSELSSYVVGCMMGRYSLDEPGLTYAHSRNEGFDPSKYSTFPADEDGIIPVTDTAWFDDDAANRLAQFISVAWPSEHLQDNLKFIAESLGSKKGESPRDTIRRYLSQGFFKHHLKMYKKRPIYWLFSSGKQRAFECLVYLHRYNEVSAHHSHH